MTTMPLEALAGHRRQMARRVSTVSALGFLLCLAVIADIATGASGMGPGTVIRGLIDPETLSRVQSVILFQVRLPQALMAVLVGAALALAGAEMQTILSNPLASPFTLGVSSAAAFGASIAIVLGISLPGIPANWIISANAFIFAFLSVLTLQALARLRGAGIETLVLFGIALVFAFNALTAMIQFVASQEALQQLVFWSMGSLSRTDWNKVGILALVVAVVLPWALAQAPALTALRLGEERALSFGLNVARLRFVALLRVSLLAATAVAFVGTIGFVGLVGPHLARLLLGEDHRFLLPASAFAGALVMSLASLAGKLLMPGVTIPVGIVTALIGVPAFLALIIGRKERS